MGMIPVAQGYLQLDLGLKSLASSTAHQRTTIFINEDDTCIVQCLANVAEDAGLLGRPALRREILAGAILPFISPGADLAEFFRLGSFVESLFTETID